MLKAMKNKLKKIVALVVVIVTVLSVFAGCGSQNEDDGVLNILCSFFPAYDWVREITAGAQNVKVELLVESGADMHSYQATAADLVKIASCDVFVYVGGVSDGWVEDALESAPSDHRTVLNFMALLPEDRKLCASEDELHEHDHEHDHAEKDAYDEHLWLSLKNAEILCEKISGKLAEIDPANSEKYVANTSEYCEKLKTLDGEYEKTVAAAENNTLIFGGRFPFTYLLNDYGLEHYSAFGGCSAESEASFETIIFLAGKVDELGVSAVMSVKGDTDSIAKTVVENTKNKNQQIIELDSMQSVTKKDIDGGATYLKNMQENLTALEKALG
ncbi:MAG: zinc ABC transporter substrate-binding protein [Clostridia bacterium]|nr:zinc ABC transporter substrate-binding protein [Clostridia bacterium]